MTQVSVVNKTTVLSDSEIANLCFALNEQSSHFWRHWGVSGNAVMIPRGKEPPPNTWQLVGLDTSDQVGALGYHETTPDGFPISYFFAKTDIEAAVEWTTTASHEFLEMLVNPWIISLVQMPDGNLTPEETADWVENNSYKASNGVWLSDFVLPCAFGVPQEARDEGRFSYRGSIGAPFTLALGGYMTVIDPQTGEITQRFNRVDPLRVGAKEEIQPWSRRWRILTRYSKPQQA